MFSAVNAAVSLAAFGTLAIRRAPVTDVQHWMGHADVQTTMRCRAAARSARDVWRRSWNTMGVDIGRRDVLNRRRLTERGQQVRLDGAARVADRGPLALLVVLEVAQQLVARLPERDV